LPLRKGQMMQRSKEKDRWYKGQKKRTDDTKAKRKGPDDTKAKRKGQMMQRSK
jgi:DNA polymerase II large subunit